MALVVNEKTFDREVLDASIPVIVNFWAPWCGLCRLVDPLLNQLQSDYQGRIKLVSINADENLKLANTYRLTTLPTVLLIEQGQVQHRLDQFHSHDELRTAIANLQTVLNQSMLSLL